MKTIGIFIVISIFFLFGCSEDITSSNGDIGDDPENNQDEWLIPSDEIRDGGPGRDGIPAINSPVFNVSDKINYLEDDDLVLGFVDGDDVRAYPHAILDWHEIINDKTENHSLAVVYCPLTGTGIGWDRILEGEETTFGVSGLLYNSNIVPYDRLTGSNWSQLLNKSVNGSLIGEKAATYNLIETTWKTWRQMFPNTKVVTTETSHNRNYQQYPYGNYKSSDNLIFPVSNTDTRLHPKERVLGVISGENAKAYRFDPSFSGNKLVQDEFQQERLVVVSNHAANFIVAYKRILSDGTELTFFPITNELPLVISDNEGTKWDITGKAVSGPRTGQQLETVQQMVGYWFAFPAFYPNVELE